MPVSVLCIPAQGEEMREPDSALLHREGHRAAQPGVGLVGNLADAAPPCTDRAPIITNACDVLREGRICFKALFSIC